MKLTIFIPLLLSFHEQATGAPAEPATTLVPLPITHANYSYVPNLSFDCLNASVGSVNYTYRSNAGWSYDNFYATYYIIAYAQSGSLVSTQPAATNAVDFRIEATFTFILPRGNANQWHAFVFSQSAPVMGQTTAAFYRNMRGAGIFFQPWPSATWQAVIDTSNSSSWTSLPHANGSTGSGCSSAFSFAQNATYDFRVTIQVADDVVSIYMGNNTGSSMVTCMSNVYLPGFGSAALGNAVNNFVYFLGWLDANYTAEGEYMYIKRFAVFKLIKTLNLTTTTAGPTTTAPLQPAYPAVGLVPLPSTHQNYTYMNAVSFDCQNSSVGSSNNTYAVTWRSAYTAYFNYYIIPAWWSCGVASSSQAANASVYNFRMEMTLSLNLQRGKTRQWLGIAISEQNPIPYLPANVPVYIQLSGVVFLFQPWPGVLWQAVIDTSNTSSPYSLPQANGIDGTGCSSLFDFSANASHNVRVTLQVADDLVSIFMGNVSSSVMYPCLVDAYMPGFGAAAVGQASRNKVHFMGWLDENNTADPGSYYVRRFALFSLAKTANTTTVAPTPRPLFPAFPAVSLVPLPYGYENGGYISKVSFDCINSSVGSVNNTYRRYPLSNTASSEFFNYFLRVASGNSGSLGSSKPLGALTSFRFEAVLQLFLPKPVQRQWFGVVISQSVPGLWHLPTSVAYAQIKGVAFFFQPYPSALWQVVIDSTNSTNLISMPVSSGVNGFGCSSAFHFSRNATYDLRIVIQAASDYVSIHMGNASSSLMTPCLNNVLVRGLGNATAGDGVSNNIHFCGWLDQSYNDEMEFIYMKRFLVFNLTNYGATAPSTRESTTPTDATTIESSTYSSSTEAMSSSSTSASTSTVTSTQVTTVQQTTEPARTVGVTSHTYDIMSYEPFSIETGFPIPAMTMAVSNIPVVKMADLAVCPFIKPSARSPHPNFPVYLTFTIDTLMGTNNMDETATFWTSIFVQWVVKECSSNYTASSIGSQEVVLGDDDVAKVWRPGMILVNSSDNMYMSGDKFVSKTYINYVPSEPNRTLYFHWIRVGEITPRCDFNLAKFPYDSITCDFTFFLEEDQPMIYFAGHYLNLAKDGIAENDRWVLTSYSNRSGTAASLVYRSRPTSFASFSLTFHRNPRYYHANFAAPLLLMVVLVLGSILMPNSPDRAAFSSTVMLSIVVIQNTIVADLPKVSQPILMSDYIQILTGLAAFVTFWQMVMVACPEKLMKRDLVLCNACFTHETWFNISIGLIANSMLVIIHVYAGVLVS